MGPEVVLATVMRPEGATGVQTHVRTTEAFLRATGRPATVVTPFDSPSALLYPIFGARLPLRRVSRSAGVWWYRRWHAHFLADALRRHLRAAPGAGVVYAQCPVAADVALRVRADQRVVMAVHFNISQALEWAEKGELRPDGALNREILAFEERILPALDGIVYVSEFMRRQVEERIPAARAVPAAVIPNAVPSVVRPRGTVGGELVTVGALQPRKNLGYLFEVLAVAARRGHRYSLTVIGDGPDRGTLERRARQLEVAGQVDFVGYQRDPRALVATHRLYCHTATMESFGIALLEAMAEGVPVVAGRVGGIPEFLQPGRVGEFWALDDTAAAADVLIGLMENPQALAAMGANAAALAAEFSPEALGTRLLAFLDSPHPAGRTSGSDPGRAASPTSRSRRGSPR
ncbi:MAG TPA: glycosyltransferase family 4 protein [Sporichthyaceae bacterium]